MLLNTPKNKGDLEVCIMNHLYPYYKVDFVCVLPAFTRYGY